MSPYGRIVALALSLLLCPQVITAQDDSRALSRYLSDVWQTEEGLPQNAIQAITQTRDGYLWLSTAHGLVRFDGARFTVFSKGNSAGLPNNRLTILYEDRGGALWIGTGHPFKIAAPARSSASASVSEPTVMRK